MYIFVYGTLKGGFRAHHYLDNTRFVGSGFTQGNLYSMGPFPALVKESGGNAHGEVYVVRSEDEEKLLQALDRFEGVLSGLYVRETAEVALEDGAVVTCGVYVAGPKLVAHTTPENKIASGCWSNGN